MLCLTRHDIISVASEQGPLLKLISFSAMIGGQHTNWVQTTRTRDLHVVPSGFWLEPASTDTPNAVLLLLPPLTSNLYLNNAQAEYEIVADYLARPFAGFLSYIMVFGPKLSIIQALVYKTRPRSRNSPLNHNFPPFSRRQSSPSLSSPEQTR